MLRALSERGADARVLSLTQGELWEARIRALGVPVVWVGQQHSRLVRTLRIIRELRRWRPDVLQSQHFYTNLYAVAAARALGLHEVGALRSDAIHEVNAGGSRVLGLLNLRAPRVIAANSRRGIENAVELGRARESLHFLPNVIDTSQFVVRTAAQTEMVHLLSIGRLVAQKRMDRFVRLVARLHARFGDRVIASIVGDGPEGERLQRLARGLGLGERTLRFAGAAADVTSWYHGADVLVLTSDYEGTPNVVIEAMASGLPVVVTHVGGVADLVRDGESGYIVDRNDEDAMLERVTRLVCDAEHRAAVGRSARAHIEQAHALTTAASALARLYEHSLGVPFSARVPQVVAR
jgi:glycosyltransferase involved in cell wall biosynthesis